MVNETVRGGGGMVELSPLERERIREQEQREALMSLLKTNSVYFNEGNNGLILKIQPEEGESGTLWEKLGLERDAGESVIKLMKVYRQGEGQREFALQKEVHENLTQVNDPGMYARVPKPMLFIDLSVDSETRDALEERGFAIASDRVEIIVMEQLRGVDLATYLYGEVLCRRFPERYTPEDITVMSFPNLQREVASALGYARLGTYKGDGAAREQGEYAVMEQNAELLRRTLENCGFHLPPAVLEQLERTVRKMHGIGIAHRDLHERNIIIDMSGDKPNVGIIDFGSAKKFDAMPASRQEMYDDAHGPRISDDALLRRLKPFTVPPMTTAEKMHSVRNERARALHDAVTALQKDAKWLSVRTMFEARNRGMHGRPLFDSAAALLHGPNPDHFFALITQALAANTLGRDEAIRYTEELLRPKKVGRKTSNTFEPYRQNRIRDFLSLLQEQGI